MWPGGGWGRVRLCRVVQHHSFLFCAYVRMYVRDVRSLPRLASEVHLPLELSATKVYVHTYSGSIRDQFTFWRMHLFFFPLVRPVLRWLYQTCNSSTTSDQSEGTRGVKLEAQLQVQMHIYMWMRWGGSAFVPLIPI
jgi:hypothetical protein